MAKINVNLYKYKNNIRMSLIKKNDKTRQDEQNREKKTPTATTTTTTQHNLI